MPAAQEHRVGQEPLAARIKIDAADSVPIKEVRLRDDEPTKTAKIGGSLDPKLESELITFLCANAECLRGNCPTCPGFPGR